MSSKGASVEEGRVDEELNRAEADELSFCPPLEDELFVPPLPLRRFSTFCREAIYRDIPIMRIRISRPINEQVVF